MIYSTAPQGSDEWLAERVGVITASRFKDARDKLKSGQPSSKALAYAYDVARERCGGKAPQVFQNAAMRFGQEQEPLARAAYEAQTGALVTEAGFICDDERIFGCSVDGMVGDDGLIEVKTIVSSEVLFRVIVEGDHSDYLDQINGALWMLGRKWCDLILWAPDLPSMKVVRITRNDDEIDKLVSDLADFAKRVDDYTARLLATMKAAA